MSNADIIKWQLLTVTGKERLSEAEKQIITLIFTGLSTKEIAQKLYIPTKEVSEHRKSIKHKIGRYEYCKLIISAFLLR